MKLIRLLIADDHPIVRIGLRSLFSTQNDVKVLGDTTCGDQAVKLAQQLRPDVLITEVAVPGCPGGPMIRHIKRACPDTAILVLSQQSEEHHAVSSLRAGAQGFISKMSPIEDIMEAVRQVAEGEVYFSRELSRQFTRASFRPSALRAPHEDLSERENEVLLKLIEGKTIGEIATQLHLSPKTVSTHKARILKKLNLTSTPALVRYALEHEIF